MHKPALQILDPAPFERRQILLIVALTLFGAGARVLYQLDRPFTGDEIGTLIFIEKDYRYLLTHFKGWLSMNYFIVAEKWFVELFGYSVAALLAIPFVFGVATIPLTALVARWFLPANASLVAALLTAANPYLIYQSVNIRAYSALIALSMLALLAFLYWLRRPGPWRGSAFAVSAFLALLMHPNGLYPLLGIGVMYVMALVSRLRYAPATQTRTQTLAQFSTLALPTLLAGLLTVLAYASIYPHMARRDTAFDQAPTDISYLSMTWADWLGPGFFAWPSVALFALALWRAIEWRAPIRILIPILLVGPVLLSLQGASFYPWSYTRFLVYALPLLLVILAYGAWTLGQRPRYRIAGAASVAVILACWVPSIVEDVVKRTEYPWSRVRDYLASEARQGDLLIGLNFGAIHDLWSKPGTVPYRKLFLSQIKPPDARPAPPGQPARRAFLVLRDLVPMTTNPTKQFGNLTVTQYALSGYQALMRDLERNLKQTVQGTWPTEPEFGSIYSAIAFAGARLGRTNPDTVYYKVGEAARSRQRRTQYARTQWRAALAERQAEPWRRKGRAGGRIGEGPQL